MVDGHIVFDQQCGNIFYKREFLRVDNFCSIRSTFFFFITTTFPRLRNIDHTDISSWRILISRSRDWSRNNSKYDRPSKNIAVMIHVYLFSFSIVRIIIFLAFKTFDKFVHSLQSNNSMVEPQFEAIYRWHKPSIKGIDPFLLSNSTA